MYDRYAIQSLSVKLAIPLPLLCIVTEGHIKSALDAKLSLLTTEARSRLLWPQDRQGQPNWDKNPLRLSQDILITLGYDCRN